MNDVRKARTAYHEAGHAVVAYHLASKSELRSVDKLTIVSDGDILGRFYGEFWPGASDWEIILIMFAGYAAERHFDANADILYSRYDYDFARKKLSRSKATEEQLLSHADKLVRENWRDIEAVAAALMERGTLERDEWISVIENT